MGRKTGQDKTEFGGDYVQNNRKHFEDLAYEAEEEFIAKAKERGLL